jgi:hypothetical protein
MSLKIFFKNEIRKVSKQPTNFDSLVQVIQEVFESNMPAKFTIKYVDNEGDKIILSTEEDYKVALETGVCPENKSLKVYLLDAEDENNTSYIIRSSVEKPEAVPPADADVAVTEVIPVPAPKKSAFEIVSVVVIKKKKSTKKNKRMMACVNNLYKGFIKNLLDNTEEPSNTVSVVSVQKRTIQEPLSAISVVSVGKRAKTEEPLSAVSVVSVGKRNEEPLSAVSVVSVGKSNKNDEPMSAVSVVSVGKRNKQVKEPKSADSAGKRVRIEDPKSAVSVVSVGKKTEEVEEPKSAVSVVSVGKRPKTEESLSPVSVVSVGKRCKDNFFNVNSLLKSIKLECF